MKIFGAVLVNGKLYEDDEIAELRGHRIGPYGSGWEYAGDQSWQEANIVAHRNSGKKGFFAGRNALPECLEFLASQQ